MYIAQAAMYTLLLKFATKPEMTSVLDKLKGIWNLVGGLLEPERINVPSTLTPDELASMKTLSNSCSKYTRMVIENQRVYIESFELIEEASWQHVQTTFNSLLEKSYNEVTSLETDTRTIVFNTCMDELSQMFVTLSEDNPDRRAATAFIIHMGDDQTLNNKLYDATVKRIKNTKSELY